MAYKELRCPYCSQMTPAYDWPAYGLKTAFFNQTRERTKDKPGAHRINIQCLQCEEDFFVVWDRDPRGGRRARKRAVEDGIQILREMIREKGVLFESEPIQRAAQALEREGSEGSKRLSGLIRELLECRSPKLLSVLEAAGQVEPDPALIEVLKEVKDAGELAPAPARQPFPPEILGDGKVGWTGGTAEDIRRKSMKTLEKLTGAVVKVQPMARPGADLDEADLAGADFDSADLRGASLRCANLEGAVLRNAILKEVDLEGANLKDANLYFSDLTGANLRDADLRGANLYASVLKDADLEGADISGAYGPSGITLPNGLRGGVHDLESFTKGPQSSSG